MAEMTAVDARSFDRRSLAHETLLAMAAAERGCSCKAYSDWFTYNRWAAQGYQVRKGEHGIRLTTLIQTYKRNDDGDRVPSGSRPKGVSVFCRCQVDKV